MIHARPVSHTLIDPQDLLDFIDGITSEDPMGALYTHLVELRDRPDPLEDAWKDAGYQSSIEVWQDEGR